MLVGEGDGEAAHGDLVFQRTTLASATATEMHFRVESFRP